MTGTCFLYWHKSTTPPAWPAVARWVKFSCKSKPNLYPRSQYVSVAANIGQNRLSIRRILFAVSSQFCWNGVTGMIFTCKVIGIPSKFYSSKYNNHAFSNNTALSITCTCKRNKAVCFPSVYCHCVTSGVFGHLTISAFKVTYSQCNRNTACAWICHVCNTGAPMRPSW